MPRKALMLLVVAAVLGVGCSKSEEVKAAPAGETTSATAAGQKPGAQGMSSESLTVPGGSENVNQPGTK